MTQTPTTRKLDVFADLLMDTCTREAVSLFPRLSTLRERARAGNVQAMTAFIDQCDSLALPTWATTDRARIVAIRDGHRS